MPYGAGDKTVLEPCISTRWHAAPATTGTTSISTLIKSDDNWNRSGSKNNQFRTRPGKSYTYRMEFKTVKVYSKKKYREFNHKTKRWVWVWKNLEGTRLIKVKTKTPNKVIEALSTSGPNTLNYVRTVFDVSSGTLQGTRDPIDYVLTRRTITGPIGQYTAVWSTVGPPLISRFDPNPIGRYTSVINEMDKKALAGLHNKIKAQSVNLGAAFAERKATISMIGDAAKRIALTLINIKKGRFIRAAKQLFPNNAKEMANDWLMFQYGIKPLMSDIQGMVKYLAKSELDEKVFKVVSGDKQVFMFHEDHSDVSCVAMKGTLLYKCTVQVKYTVHIKVTNRFLADIGNLGLTNLESIAWEVIPFSFIVDWFLPIGNWLNSLDAFQGLSVASCHKTIFITEESSFHGAPQGKTTDNWYWTGDPIRWKKKTVQCARVLLASPPAIPSPEFKNPFSRDHILNALALLAQAR